MKRKFMALALAAAMTVSMTSAVFAADEIKSADDLEGKTEEKIEVKNNEKKEPTHTIEEIRAVLSGKSENGFTEQVRDAIVKFGGGKLSTVPKENYDLLYEEALKIGGGAK